MKPRSLASLVAVSALTLTCGAASATNLSYNNPFPSSHTVQAAGMDPFAEAVEESSDGTLRITIHSGGVMADGAATLGAIQRSIVDAGLVVPAWVASQLPVTETLAQFQLAASDPRVAAGAANEFFLRHCPECQEENNKVNTRPLAYYGSAPYHFICRRPLDELDDLAGKRVRASSAPLVNWVEQFDATAVAIPTGDIYQALQRGQADCTVGPLAYFRTLSLDEVSQWVSDLAFGSYYGATIISVNSSTWERLDEAQQTAVTGNLASLVRDVVEGYMRDTDEARARALEEGVTFAEVSDSDQQKLETHVDREFDRVLQVARDRGVGGSDPEALLNRFMETLEKWQTLVADMGDDFDAYEQALEDEVFSQL